MDRKKYLQLENNRHEENIEERFTHITRGQREENTKTNYQNRL